jgi:LysM repeat protein
MGDIRVAGSASPATAADTQAPDTVLVKSGDTLKQIADDQNVDVSDLLAANPQIGDPDHLSAGMEIHIPPRTSGGKSVRPKEDDERNGKTSSAAAKRAEASLDSIAMRGLLSSRSYGGSDGQASAASAAPSQEASETPVDPRFDDFNEALQAGDGEKATAAASELLAQLQAEKPPQLGLINQARMSLAAGAMLKGDFSQAQKALLAIDSKKLNPAEKQQFDELRDLLADAHRQAFSDAFKADSADGADATKGRGKAASDEAKSLLELLQKTDPGNAPAINDTRLKLANAQLMGGNYRDAEKTLTAVNEKQLIPEQKQYLDAIRQEVHAQQIDALGSAYVSDMTHKRYKDAASNATAMVNDLAKNFPDAKSEIVGARLQQATAQIMGDDMEGARTSLAHVNRDDLKQMPKEAQDRFRELNVAVTKHFEAVKKMEILKAEQAAIETQVKTIDALTTSGNKAMAQQAVPLAEKLVATIQEKYPDNTKAIDGARLTLANAKLEAGDRAGAMSDLQAIAASTTDPSTKDQAQLFQARAILHGGDTDKAVNMLRELSNTATTPEVRKAAKDVIISIQTGYLRNVEKKAGLEQSRLEAIKVEKDPSGWSLLNPVTAVKFIAHGYDNLLEDHQRNMNYLGVVGSGANDLANAMKKNGMTLEELAKMDFKHLAALPGVGEQSAREIQIALGNVDVQTVAKGNFQGKNFSWEKNTWYVDASYLDTEMDKVSKWVGNQVRGARNFDEELKKSDSLFDRAVGYTSGAILDGVSAANDFVKDKIKTAEDFYNDPSRKDAWYSKLGRVGTFGADVLASTFTMPATMVDYKATDAERSGAITGTLLMVGTLGVIKGGGPAWESLGAGASRVGSRIASTEMAQALAKSEFGQWAGRTAVKIGEGAAKLETKFEATSIAKGADKVKAGLGKVEKAFEETRFAKGMDKVKATLGKDVIGGTKFAPSKGMDSAVDELLGRKTAGDLKASITPKDLENVENDLIKAKRKEITKTIKKEVIADLKNRGTPASELEAKATKATEEMVNNNFPESRLRKLVKEDFSTEDMQRMVLSDRIYHDIYHGEFPEKVANLKPEMQTAYEQKLTAAKGAPVEGKQDLWEMPDGKGLIQEDGYWQHRVSDVNGKVGLSNEAIQSGEDIRRFYFNLKPDKAGEFADYMTEKLNEKSLSWQYKMPKELKNFDRPDAGVLYVDKADYQAVKKIVTDYAKEHPEAFAEGTPGFTKSIGKGIGVAEEPLQTALPKNPNGRYSFGEFRSDVIADTVLKAPPGATKAEIMAAVRKRMEDLGLDADKPWLQRRGAVDDL